jgi:hypothetical protein
LKIPGLPQGDFDIPLALAAKRYNADGSLWDPEANNEETSVFVSKVQVLMGHAKCADFVL